MALFSIQTNFKKNEVPRELISEISNAIASSLNRKMEDIAGNIVYDVNTIWRGSLSPVVLMTLQTIQYLNKDLNENIVSSITSCISKLTSVNSDRIIINLVEKVTSDMAINGSSLIKSN